MAEIDVELDRGEANCVKLPRELNYSCDSVAYECSGDQSLYRVKSVYSKQSHELV